MPMSKTFETKVAEFIKERSLFAQNEKVLVAVSGGADSVAAACVLKSIGFDIGICHINHNLRGIQSDGDEKFVKNLAEKLGVRFFLLSIDVKEYAKKNKLSLETAGREVRINEITRIAKDNSYSIIATGHHRDDNAETIIFRLQRGTAFRGLGGIKPVSLINGTKFVRPLLSVSKAEILNYLNENGQDFRHDHTNDELDFDRNKIRHRLLPHLQKQMSSDIYEKLFKLSLNSQKFIDAVEKQTNNFLDDISVENSKIKIDADTFNRLSIFVKSEVICQSLIRLGVGLQKLNEQHYKSIIDIASERAGMVNLPQGFKAEIDGEFLIIKTQSREETHTQKKLELNGSIEFANIILESTVLDPIQCDFDEFIKTKDKNIEWFNIDKIQGDIVVRYRERGDKIVPLGKKHSRKIGDLTNDKDAIVLTDSKNILWLIGQRPSELVKVDDSTKTILQIKCI